MNINEFSNVLTFIENEHPPIQLNDKEVYSQYIKWLDTQEINSGFNTYRHKNNPLEKEAHDKFVNEFKNDLDYIIFNNNPDGDKKLNVRERKIVFSAMQWVVSHVGYHFFEPFFNRNK